MCREHRTLPRVSEQHKDRLEPTPREPHRVVWCLSRSRPAARGRSGEVASDLIEVAVSLRMRQGEGQGSWECKRENEDETWPRNLIRGRRGISPRACWTGSWRKEERIAALRGPEEGWPAQAGPPHPLPIVGILS